MIAKLQTSRRFVSSCTKLSVVVTTALDGWQHCADDGLMDSLLTDNMPDTLSSTSCMCGPILFRPLHCFLHFVILAELYSGDSIFSCPQQCCFCPQLCGFCPQLCGFCPKLCCCVVLNCMVLSSTVWFLSPTVWFLSPTVNCVILS